MNQSTDTRKSRLLEAVRDIPDFPKPGIVFKDITPILGDPQLFRDCLDLLEEFCRSLNAERIAAIDARGFIVGGALADRLGIGLALVRKKGKLPHSTLEQSYDLEYGTSTLAMHDDAILTGERVLIIDDVLATGGTAEATARLIEDLGGQLVGCAFMMELAYLNGREKFGATPVFAVLAYDEE